VFLVRATLPTLSRYGGRWLAIAVVTFGIASGAAPRAGAQQAPASDSKVVKTLGELSKYAGWGMAIGAGLGLVYGLTAEHRTTRRLDIVGDSLIGAVAGLAAGTVVYVVKSIVRRRG
jgi:hypothetical protein